MHDIAKEKRPRPREEKVEIEVEVVRSSEPVSPARRAAREQFMLALADLLLDE